MTDWCLGHVVANKNILHVKPDVLSGRGEISESEGDIVFDKTGFGK